MRIIYNPEDESITEQPNSEAPSEPKKEPDVHYEDTLELKTLPFFARQKEKRRRFKAKLDGMEKEERKSYLLTYYKWPAIITVALIIFVISTGITIYKNKRPAAIAFAILNCESPENINTDFVADYRKQFNIKKSYRTSALTDLSLDESYNFTKTDAMSTTSEYSEFPLMCYDGMYDVLISDEAGTVYCGKQEIITSLEIYFPDKILSQLEQNRIFYSENFDGEKVPVAINISNTEFAKNLNLSYDKVYLSFPGATEENYDNAVRMIEYIFGLDLTNN